LKIGLALWNLYAKNITEKIERVKAMGFTSVSFLGSSFEEENTDSVISAVKRNDLTVTFHLSFFGIDRKRLMEDLKNRLNSLNALFERDGFGKHVRCVCFDPAFDEKDGKVVFNYQNTADAIKLSLEMLKDIRIGIENWTVNSRIEQFEKLKKEVNDKRLGMLFDIGHMNIALKAGLAETGDINEYIKRIPMDIIEFHVHDNNGEIDEHLPLGMGKIDIDTLLKAVKQYNKYISETVFSFEIVSAGKGTARKVPGAAGKLSPEKIRKIAMENRSLLENKLKEYGIE
jgi:sugar phosphate isomerase/epimerase